MMGQKEESHTLVKIEKGSVYSVDFDQKLITKIPLEKFFQSSQELGEYTIESLGAKKTGSGKVLGYECDIWESNGAKVWLYKGIMLRSVTSALGMEHTVIATDAKFNITVPKEKFILPDYPVKTLDELGYGTREQEEKQEEKKPTQEQLDDMMKNLGNLFGN